MKLYKEIIDIYKLILPMSDEEFTRVLHLDEYGNINPKQAAILSLLEKIKDKQEFERHELIIYKVLSNIKNNKKMKEEQKKKTFSFSYDIGDIVYHKATGHKCIVTGHLVDRREVMYNIAMSPLDRSTVYSIEITDEEPIFNLEDDELL